VRLCGDARASGAIAPRSKAVKSRKEKIMVDVGRRLDRTAEEGHQVSQTICTFENA
jgi:hypothetical protein